MTGQRWTQDLWAAGEPVYEAILAHPFLTGLTDGTLAEAAFAEYLAQDAHYLRDYARALAVLGAKAPTHELTGLFAGHAAQTVAVELALHGELLPALGVDPGAVEPSPTCRAYTDFLVRVAHDGTFAEALAAVLPCYWIYQRVGESLVVAGSPNPRFQRWIDTYAGQEFAATVAAVLEVADRIGPELAGAERRRAQAHFVTAARYEWRFWDAAHRLERWLP